MLGIRDLLKTLSPPWLQTGVAEKFLYVCGLGADALLEKLNQGVRLHMPGYGDPSGLPYVGNDRLIGQGLTETSAQYATRLKYWLDDWRIAGSPHAVLQQVLGYLSQLAPMVRTVSDSSAWDYYAPQTSAQNAGPTHYLASPANWNWDNEGDPHPAGVKAWWRWWLLLFPNTGASLTVTGATNASPIVVTTQNPHGLASNATVYIAGVGGNAAANGQWIVTVQSTTTLALNGSTGSGAYTSGGTLTPTFTSNEGTWGDGATWGDATASWGLSVPASVVTSIRNIVSLWKQAGSWCRWIVISFDNTLFDPAQTADGVHDPNGAWGHWSVITSNVYVPSRPASGRYCDGV